MEGGYIPVALYLDAKSVFAAISATFIKQPAEKSLLCHVQYLRELLDKRVLQYHFGLTLEIWEPMDSPPEEQLPVLCCIRTWMDS